MTNTDPEAPPQPPPSPSSSSASSSSELITNEPKCIHDFSDSASSVSSHNRGYERTWTSRAMWTMLLVICVGLFILLALDSLMVAREHRRRGRAFPRGRTVLDRSGELFLSDYFTADDILPQRDLKRLRLSLSVENIPLPPHVFYRYCTQHLRAAAPNLEEIALDGGYIWRPETAEVNVVEAEFQLIKDTLEAVDEAMTAMALRIIVWEFEAVVVAGREQIDSAEYFGPLLSVFGHRPDKFSTYLRSYDIPLQLRRSQCQLRIRFVEPPPTTTMETQIRQRYVTPHSDEDITVDFRTIFNEKLNRTIVLNANGDHSRVLAGRLVSFEEVKRAVDAEQ